MNIETNQENSEITSIGTRLRQAREKLGLSQQAVAERLCLMLSTVREIEEDRISPKLAPTFARGYVRSYAKLVEIPEDEVLSMMPTGESSKINRNTAPMQSFSYAKKRKKRDGWLMLITFVIIAVVIGLTGAWWWENYKAQQTELDAMISGPPEVLQSTGQQKENVTSETTGREVPVQLMPSEPAAETQVTPGQVQTQPQPVPLVTQAQTPGEQPGSTTPAPAAAPPVSTPPVSVVPGATEQSQSAVPPAGAAPASAQAPQGQHLQITPEAALQAAATQAQQQMQSQTPAATTPAATGKALVINFTADCWIEVRDATGKELVSTLKRKGSSLDLEGEPPYKIKLGVPSAVQIIWQGNAVDLGDIAKSHQVARLTIPLQQ
ncbi:MAG: cytoskeleton protein RodZ [Enterobacteriaceae bacterium]